MRSNPGRRWAIVATIAMLLAQGAIPPNLGAHQADSPATPVASPPAVGIRCDARPASAAGIVAIMRQPTVADPAAEAPQGEPLPPAERVFVGDVVARWSACLGAGNVRGLLGLFTADGARRLLTERAPYVGSPAGLRVKILAVSDVVRMSDGRVAARVTVDPSGSGQLPPESVLFVFEREGDGGWKIDHVRPPEGPTGAAGQPGRDPFGPLRPVLRTPIAPGPDVPMPAPGPAVPMRGADAGRTGNQPGPVPDAAPSERWRVQTGWHSQAMPVVARGLVIFGSFSLGERLPLLSAVDAASGSVRWQTTAPVAWAEFPDAPALAGDVVFAPVQAPVAGVMAVAAATGQPLWYAPFGFTSVTAPAVDADAVYVSGWGVRDVRNRADDTPSGAVFALDQRTGRERWRFLAPVRFGPLAAGRDAIFVPSDHGLYALDRATGRKRWQARFTPRAGDTPAVIGDTVAFAGTDVTSGNSGVFALDAASGALRWRVALDSPFRSRAGGAATGETFYVAWWQDDAEGQGGHPTLRAFDLRSGEERWTYSGPAAGVAGTVTEPMIAGDAVLFGVALPPAATGDDANLSGLYAIDMATGAVRWQAGVTTPIRSAPAALGTMIYTMGDAQSSNNDRRGFVVGFAAE